mgnify:FL=1
MFYLLFLVLYKLLIKLRIEVVKILFIQLGLYLFQRLPETLEMHDFPFSQEAQWREHIGVIRQVDEIFIGAARFLLCCVGVSAKKKAGESKDSLAFLNFAIIRW